MAGSRCAGRVNRNAVMRKQRWMAACASVPVCAAAKTRQSGAPISAQHMHRGRRAGSSARLAAQKLDDELNLQKVSNT